MKPLEKGRRALNWMGIYFADDEPVSWRLKIVQKLFSIAFALTFITFATLNAMAFRKLQSITPEEFFFVLVQFVMSLHVSSGLITFYLNGSGISTMFQRLTEIYEKCKQIEQFNGLCFSIQ